MFQILACTATLDMMCGPFSIAKSEEVKVFQSLYYLASNFFHCSAKLMISHKKVPPMKDSSMKVEHSYVLTSCVNFHM